MCEVGGACVDTTKGTITRCGNSKGGGVGHRLYSIPQVCQARATVAAPLQAFAEHPREMRISEYFSFLLFSVVPPLPSLPSPSLSLPPRCLPTLSIVPIAVDRGWQAQFLDQLVRGCVSRCARPPSPAALPCTPDPPPPSPHLSLYHRERGEREREGRRRRERGGGDDA